MRWFRGNLHTHTTNSDGDSAPDEVVAWYRDAGYDFLALTDHDLLTLPRDHAAAATPMLLIHGEEVTAGDVHVNGLGIRSTISPVIGATVAETLQRNVDAVMADGGMASVNHPNYRWQVRAADLIALGGCRLLEVFNGGPETNNGGGAGRPSHDALWDAVLSAERRFHAIAVDDAHYFKVFGRPYSNPGRGWVHIRAASLSEATVLQALANGDFYASSGVELADVSSGRRELAIDIVPQYDLAYRTTFMGRGGEVLDVVDGVAPRYAVSGHEGYVRARIDDSDGLSAWVQPLFLD
ncbi:MAG TPA: CehA/McbA family metallohydrolase [Candidatus Deferrimicrobium sp.]|nr:CehA/McbA family metallohydrolase [Candidatus Deferrimicrobium sp.]